MEEEHRHGGAYDSGISAVSWGMVAVEIGEA